MRNALALGRCFKPLLIFREVQGIGQALYYFESVVFKRIEDQIASGFDTPGLEVATKAAAVIRFSSNPEEMDLLLSLTRKG